MGDLEAIFLYFRAIPVPRLGHFILEFMSSKIPWFYMIWRWAFASNLLCVLCVIFLRARIRLGRSARDWDVRKSGSEWVYVFRFHNEWPTDVGVYKKVDVCFWVLQCIDRHCPFWESPPRVDNSCVCVKRSFVKLLR